jgi:Caspase domain
MAGRYRALLIGNSTYPADEHNLQPLKGPVKDIAALNRALIDPANGLFADVDVTLLPETTSARAIRALGRFIAAAARGDVLLVYFSGHGKLDQGGRLHLCMQDTEAAGLLSTAVSSARINEFADASHARNVVIVLDCCYAGAFRGSDLGDAVAGPASSSRSDGWTAMVTCRWPGGRHRHLRKSPPQHWRSPLARIYERGSFRWQVSDSGCVVAPLAGPGQDKLPLAWDGAGDSDAFTVPARVAVQVKDYEGSPDCKITLNDPGNGETIDFQTATRGKADNTVVLDVTGHSTAYVSGLSCGVRVSPAP